MVKGAVTEVLVAAGRSNGSLSNSRNSSRVLQLTDPGTVLNTAVLIAPFGKDE